MLEIYSLFQIPYGGKYSKDYILKTLLASVAPTIFIPLRVSFCHSFSMLSLIKADIWMHILSLEYFFKILIVPHVPILFH